LNKTLSEKIIGNAVGKDVAAGDIVVVNIDLAYMNDASGPLAIEKIKETTDNKMQVFNKDKTVIFIDHTAPSCHKDLSNSQALLRNFAKETGCRLYDVNEGVCHQLAAEHFVKPGDIIVGGDSHTCTGGAFGAFATGMGATDVGVAIALGQTWLRVPESLKIKVTRLLGTGVYAKDLILHTIGLITADGASYKAIDFMGDTIETMDMEDRITLSNMAVEAGAKVGLISSDSVTKEYLEKMNRPGDWKGVSPDHDANYEKVIEIDASEIEPTVSVPHEVDNTKTIKDVAGTKIDQAFIGSCTNGRLSDLEIAAAILKDRKVHPSVRLIVVIRKL